MNSIFPPNYKEKATPFLNHLFMCSFSLAAGMGYVALIRGVYTWRAMPLIVIAFIHSVVGWYHLLGGKIERKKKK